MFAPVIDAIAALRASGLEFTRVNNGYLMDYLGLPHIASVRYSSLGSQVAFDRPAEPITVDSDNSLPVEPYAGKYANTGYPTIKLCDPRSSADDPECEDTFAAYRSLYDLSTCNNTLYFSLPSPWVSHGKLERLDGNTFTLSATNIFPKGYGKDRTPFETTMFPKSGIEAKFVVENGTVVGLGVFGLVGEQTEQQRIGGSIEETAEVWFEKV